MIRMHVAKETLSSFAVFENGIGFVEPGSVPSPPATVVFDGHLFRRFMDFIYLPAPADDLTRDQVISVNRLREHLIEMWLFTSANARVKQRMATAVRTLAPCSVLEWGCGYRSIEPFLPAGAGYMAVDVDPNVVSYQRARGTRCFLADQLLEGACTDSHDVILSAFVFHFDIPGRHIAAMHRLLRAEGLVLANVYRRAERSRARLRDAFAAHGFKLIAKPDPDRLCRAHEYWVLHKGIEHPRTRTLIRTL